MSYVDRSERSSRTFAERFQDVWERPTPFGLIAQIKTLLGAPETIRGLVDASRVVTGPAPSTEEEAERYNQARDYLPRAAFEMAGVLTPTAPKAVRGLPVRPNGSSGLRGEGQSEARDGVLGGGSRESLQSGPRPQFPRYSYTEPSIVQASPQAPLGGVFNGLVLPPTQLPWWMQALLPAGGAPAGVNGLVPAGAFGRHAFMPAPASVGKPVGAMEPRVGRGTSERPSSRPPLAPEPNGGGSLPPSILGLAGLPGQADPNHRELRRIGQSSPDAARAGPDGDDKPSLGVTSPPLVPDQEPPANYSDADASGSGSGGGSGDGVRSGGNDNERRRECIQDWQDEKNDWCRQFGFVRPVYERICKEIADVRLQQCYQNEPQRGKFTMKEVDPEDVKTFLARQREAEKKRSGKSKKRR